MESLQEKLRSMLLEHTVKMSIIGALNLSEEKYDEIKLETDLASDLGIDSLDAAEIIMRIEEDHDLEEIPEDYARKANTVKHIYDYVVGHCTKSLDKLVDLSKQDNYLKKFLGKLAETSGLQLSELEAASSIGELELKFSAASKK